MFTDLATGQFQNLMCILMEFAKTSFLKYHVDIIYQHGRHVHETRAKRKPRNKPKIHLEPADNENEECRICREYKITHALIPCGHRYSCQQCFQKIKK